jgi:hypothetical protein
MITKLDKTQEGMLISIRDEYLGRVFKNGEKESNRPLVYSLVKNWLYPLCDLEAPVVIEVDSPFAAQLATNYVVKILDTQVHDQVYAQVHAQVINQVGARVHNQVGDQVNAQVSDQVYAQVYDQVNNQVRAQVINQVDTFYNSGWRISLWDAGWRAYLDAMVRIGIVLEDRLKKDLESWLTLGRYISYNIPLKGAFIYSKYPVNIYRDSDNNLHNEHGLAIEYEDGWGFYALHGVRLDKELWDRILSKSMSFEDALNIENIEYRRLALEYLDPDSLLEGANAKLIHKGVEQDVKVLRTDWSKVKKVGQGYDQESFFENTKEEVVKAQNILYEVQLKDWDKPYRCIRYSDPSTGRVYIAWVEGSESDADEAMAKRHHTNKQDYLNIKQQA